MERLKYSFKNFIPNGMGADFIRICRLYSYCKLRDIDLYMDEDDKWMIANDGNWRTLFNSLNMTKEDMPLVTNEIMKDAESYNKSLLFKGMVECVNELYVPKDKYKVEIQSDSKYAVVHVRRGDKVKGRWKEGVYHELDEYLEHTKEYDNKDVFVMSDSPDVAEEAKSKGCMIDEKEQRRDGYVYKMYYGIDHHNTIDPKVNYFKHSYTDNDIEDELNIFFKNMEIFRHATHLVGSNSSFYYVLGQLLNGKKGVSLSNLTDFRISGGYVTL